VRGYSAAVGFEIGAHALRATAATNALDHQADIAKVQEWLGHANISTTRIYDHRKTRPEDECPTHLLIGRAKASGCCYLLGDDPQPCPMITAPAAMEGTGETDSLAEGTRFEPPVPLEPKLCLSTEAGGFRGRIRSRVSQLTRRWRELDSNLRSPTDTVVGSSSQLYSHDGWRLR
jgi:hypothetical protein